MSFLQRLAGGSGWVYLLFCLFIGLIGTLGHAPYFIWPITLVMFAVLLHLIWLSPTQRRAFWTGMMVGLGYFAGQIYWIGSAFVARGEEFVVLMPFMVGGLAMVLAYFWGLAGWLFKKYCTNSRFPYLIIAGLIFLAEVVRGHLFGGFPWNLPGYVFKAGGPLSQSASLIGVYGLSFLILLISALVARSLFKKHNLSGWIGALLVVANLGFGLLRLYSAEVTFVDNVKVRIVSAPFSQKDKLDPDQPMKSQEIVQDHINLTASPGLESVTHVIWPEGVLDFDIRMVPQVRMAMGQTLTNSAGPPPIWIVNSSRIEDTGETVNYYNSSSAWSFADRVDGEILGVADKRKLVPFGEIIPGGKWVERLGARVISENIGSFTPAATKNVMQITGLPPGTIQICYEVIFSGFTARSAEVRPTWILNQSNDAWFGSSIGLDHHSNIARYRAIEERMPVIRSAANGFSGIVDPYGRFVDYAAPDSRQAIDLPLPHALGESLPFKWVNLIWVLLTLTLVLIARRRG